MLIGLAFDILLVATCVGAAWRGGVGERQAAAVSAAGALATFLATKPLDDRFLGPNGALLVVDALVALGYVAVALRSRTFWPVWAAACQVLAAYAALDMYLSPRINTLPAAVSEQVWGWVPLFIIMWQLRRTSATRHAAH